MSLPSLKLSLFSLCFANANVKICANIDGHTLYKATTKLVQF